MSLIRRDLLRTCTVAALASLLVTSCSGKLHDYAIPHSICETPISRQLTEPLLQPIGTVSEWTSVGFRTAGESSWCVVFVNGNDAVHVNFASHSGAMDPMSAASPDDPVTGLQNPRPIRLSDSAVIGDDGAIATTHCKDKAGADHFTLALKVTRGEVSARRTVAIERFMRAYMPATVRTLGCLKEKE
ncbi:hypothetical protein [Streptomyces sp. NPDC059786]|uniref:hypothetical protein n=1 Tax=Streptomyces sp. NPDC059786 TaxID=3346946 RepID=UPI003656FDB3